MAWRSLWRDLRAGGLRLLVVAVVLAVGALTAVGFFADRLGVGLQRDAAQLLGGDVVVASDQPTAPALLAQAQALGLASASSVSFPTMARASETQGGASRLVALKAVEPGYPLRGSLLLAGLPGQPAQAARAIPARGQVWVDAAVLDALGLTVGDQLLLGDSSLRISHTIVQEPDRGSGFLSFAPRVMMQQADLAATALVQPASRLSYRFAVAGQAQPVRQFLQAAEAQIARAGLRGTRIESLESGRPEMRQTLERAENFLRLVALLAALLSAVAVALAARAFAASHLDDCAMLRVLGLSQRRIAASYCLEFVLVGLLASALGLALGYVVHHGFVYLLAGLVQTQLPPPSWRPLVLGLGMGLTLLLAFGLPPVLQLAQVPALRVIRRELGGLRPASVLVLLLGILGFGVLLLAASDDLRLGLITVGGFAGAVLLFAALASLAVWLLRRLVRQSSAPRALVLATRQLAARPLAAVLQVSSLAVGLLALLLLVLLRTDLIASWQQATPADAPNRFVINILPEQGPAFRQFLQDAGVRDYDWYPMVRGRLVAINGQPVVAQAFAEERARHLVEREFNISYSSALPSHNTLAAGEWSSGEADTLSVESGIAQTLGLRLGDTLSFDMAGVTSQARITSLRQLDWGSLRANFFVLYPHALPPELHATYLAAFRAPEQPGFDKQLTQQFPNTTAVDLGQSLAQLQQVLGQVVRAVEFLFVFTLAAGLLVLFAAVGASRGERARELAIMRALGASARLLRQVQNVELLGVGLLAGLLAAAVAALVGAALAHYVFDFRWAVSPGVLLVGALAGAGLAWAAGWWSLRGLLRQPVAQSLRQGAD